MPETGRARQLRGATSAGCPRFDHWWAFVVRPRDPPPRGQRSRGLRGGSPRPHDQEAPASSSADSPLLGGVNVAIAPVGTPGVHVVPDPGGHDLRHPRPSRRHRPPAVRRHAPVRRPAPRHVAARRTARRCPSAPTATEARHNEAAARPRPDAVRLCLRRRPQALAMAAAVRSPHRPEGLGHRVAADRPAAARPRSRLARRPARPARRPCGEPSPAAGWWSGRPSGGATGGTSRPRPTTTCAGCGRGPTGTTPWSAVRPPLDAPGRDTDGLEHGCA